MSTIDGGGGDFDYGDTGDDGADGLWQECRSLILARRSGEIDAADYRLAMIDLADENGYADRWEMLAEVGFMNPDEAARESADERDRTERPWMYIPVHGER